MQSTTEEEEALGAGRAEQPGAAPAAPRPKHSRRSVMQLLALVAEEHDREIAEIRLHYEARLKAAQLDLEEKEREVENVCAMASSVSISFAASTSLASEGRLQSEPRVVVELKDEFAEAPQERRKSSLKRANNQVALLHNAEYRDTVTAFRHVFEHYIDIVATVIVMLHIVFLIIQMQFSGHRIAEEAGIIDALPPRDGSELVLDVFDHVFNAFFIVEMTVRILCLKRRFFLTEHGRVEWFNLIELILVTATSVELYMTSWNMFNFNAFRPVIRFIRLLRTMRVLKLVKFFFKLRVLVSTVAASFMALFWSIVLLVITMLMAALILNQLLVMEMLSEELPWTRREWIYQMYGTSLRASYTVFEITFSGGWPNYARPLVEEVSPYWALFFFIYIISVVFAMFRIITALFLRDTLALAADDAETAIHEKLQEKKATAKKLREFFEVADTSGDGMLSLDEFQEMIELPRVCTWLSLLEIDVHGAKELFSLLEDSDRQVSVEDFVQGMMRIKGQAKAQEVHEILIKQRKMYEAMRSVTKRLESIDRSMKTIPRETQLEV